jgi:hypothetical protein
MFDCFDIFFLKTNLIYDFFCVVNISKELSIGGISQFAMSRLRKKHHLNIDVQK